MSFITRFAPSPTGDLHIGSVRTALYCWLFAKKHNGKMILRIEDTDLQRSTKESVEIILNGLKWLNLSWDAGPFFQSERFPRYLAVIDELLAKNLAYRCDCTKERLEHLRAEQIAAKQKPKYDHLCREKNLPKSHPLSYVVRFKTPLTGYIEFEDLVRGVVKTANAELDDLILLRSDSTPTYNFTVVIDDLDMNITDVIRGEDHISNTPKQIHLLLALNAKIPRYAHIPMILGSDGARLSKRHGAASVLEYKNLGILPHALINYLARLGWAYKDQEIFSIEELIKLFDIKTVHKAPAIFNLDKLLWLNQHYINKSDINVLIPLFIDQLKSLGLSSELVNISDKYHYQIISLQKNRVKTIKEMAEESTYFYQEQLIFDPSMMAQQFPEILKNIKNNHQIILSLNSLLIALNNLQDWHIDNIHSLLKSITAEFNLKFSDLAIPLRVITTGKDKTPSIDQTLTLLGKQKVLTRIDNGINLLQEIK